MAEAHCKSPPQHTHTHKRSVILGNKTELPVTMQCPLVTFCVRLSIKQHKRCTYNITLWRVRVTTVDVEKHSVLHILSIV